MCAARAILIGVSNGLIKRHQNPWGIYNIAEKICAGDCASDLGGQTNPRQTK